MHQEDAHAEPVSRLALALANLSEVAFDLPVILARVDTDTIEASDTLLHRLLWQMLAIKLHCFMEALSPVLSELGATAHGSGVLRLIAPIKDALWHKREAIAEYRHAVVAHGGVRPEIRHQFWRMARLREVVTHPQWIVLAKAAYALTELLAKACPLDWRSGLNALSNEALACAPLVRDRFSQPSSISLDDLRAHVQSILAELDTDS